MDTDKIVLTREGFDKLQSEQKQLVEQDMPQILKDIEEARILGDLRENEAYHAARHKQALLAGRIEELNHILKDAEVVEEGERESGTLMVGSTVKLKMNDAHKEFKIVGEHEADITQSKISLSSPLGSALVGKEVGDLVKVEVPSGFVEYKIVSID